MTDSKSGIAKRKSEGRVYVSNIPYELKWQDLKDLFRTEVGDITFVELFTDTAGRPKGSAIIVFDTVDTAEKAINIMHEKEVMGRKLILKKAEDIIHSRDFGTLYKNDNRANKDVGRQTSSFRGNDFGPIGSSQIANNANTFGLSVSFLECLGITDPLVNRVFVSNLDYKVTEEELMEVFKVAGTVVRAEILTNEDGNSKGFAIIEYEHPLQAVQAISMLHTQTYQNRKLAVRLDRAPVKKRVNDDSAKLPPGLKGLGFGLGLNGKPITDVNSFATATPALNSIGIGSSISPAFCMSSNNGLGAAMPNQGNGSMTGLDTSSIALGMRANISNLAALHQNNTNSFPNSNLGQNMFSGNTSNAFLNQSPPNMNNFKFNSQNVVQVCNLPPDYNWKDLKDLCRSYGDIRFSEIKSAGVGWVRFSSEYEAGRAAGSLNGHRFDGKILSTCVI